MAFGLVFRTCPGGQEYKCQAEKRKNDDFHVIYFLFLLIHAVHQKEEKHQGSKSYAWNLRFLLEETLGENG
tara:strand:- start:49 stop:261 length:213 start_codon:yes stop_codon:yes gene_type:complete